MVYFDNNASAPLSPFIQEKLKYYSSLFLVNPSSQHSAGRAIKALLEDARRRIACYFSVDMRSVIFTSSGTESINHAIKSCFVQHSIKKVFSSNVEHSATEEMLQWLEEQGVEVTRFDVGAYGAISDEQVMEIDFSQYDLVTLIAANNETGVLNPISKIAQKTSEAKIPFILDAVAWLGKKDFLLPSGVTHACFSGQKIHAPSGIGVLISKDPSLQPLIRGGYHEFGFRGGSPNVLGALLFADALSDFSEHAQERIAHMYSLRDYFEHKMLDLVGAQVNGLGPRVSNVSNLYLPDVDGEELLMRLDLKQIYTSLGSACSSGSLEPSRVLLNMGRSLREALCCMRFSFSYLNSVNEIDFLIENL